MSYIVYSATSLESFLKRKVEKDGEIYYHKSLHKPKYHTQINYTNDFFVSTDRARMRFLEKKTPLVMTLEADKRRGQMKGNLPHIVLELWLEKYHAPEPNFEIQKFGFVRYEPKQLMRLLLDYELIGSIFIRKQQ